MKGMNLLKLRDRIAAAAVSALIPYFALTGPLSRAQSDVIRTDLRVDRKDAGLDKIVPEGAQLEELAAGYTWLDGPVWVEGSLFYSDIPANAIYRWTPGRGVATFMEPSGYKGKEPYGGPEPGTDGMTLDPHGRLTVAGHASRTVIRFEPLDPNGIVTILADSYEGKKLNSPNDVVYRSDGSAYFTDPPYGLRTQSDDDPEKELKVNGVYRIPRALMHKPGEPPISAQLQLIISDLTRPNGIAFSPDEKFLYVSNSEPKKIWMQYSVNKDGTVTDPKLLYDATGDPRRGKPDGMRVDVQGNIYSAAPGGVIVLTPDGKVLGTLLVPEEVSNVAWAGPENKTLYITASNKLYRVRLSIAGQPLVRITKR